MPESLEGQRGCHFEALDCGWDHKDTKNQRIEPAKGPPNFDPLRRVHCREEFVVPWR